MSRCMLCHHSESNDQKMNLTNVASYVAMAAGVCGALVSDSANGATARDSASDCWGAHPSIGAFETTVHGLPVGAVNVYCAKSGRWSFDVNGTLVEDGVAEVTITLACAAETQPRGTDPASGL